MDFLTLSLGFALIPAFVDPRLTASAPHYQGLTPVALATMAITIFSFSGTYLRHRTPLGIADTASLLRGAACAILLFTVSCFSTRTVPGTDFVVTAGLILVLLIVQRELLHSFRPSSLATAAFEMRSGHERYEVQEADVFHLQKAGASDLPSHLLKRAVDVAGAAILLVLALPFLLCVAVLIKLDSAGPVFIRQRRIGRGGESFCMWKFRSMHARVHRYARSPVSDADPRLTNLGRTLRRFSIDEIPQLLNVLQGDMSLVGPRPEMPFIVENYNPHERLRLNALPGITGLWQISPARAMPIHENVGLDLFYIHNQSIFLDLAILLRTVTAVFRGIGAA